MVNVNLQQRLSLKLKFSYGVGHVLNDLCASMWFSYMLLYLHKVVAFSNVNAGWLILTGQIADALSTPFVGYESDRTVCVSYGRRKIWHLIGVLCVACSFPFIFNLCLFNCANAPETSLMAYYIPFIVLFQFGWASTQISHLSLIPELTKVKQVKVELNALRYMFTVISNLIVFAVCFLLFELHAEESAEGGDNLVLCRNDAPKFRYLAICVVGLGLVFMVIFHAGVKENPHVDSNIISSCEEDAQASVGSQKEDIDPQFKISTWFKTPLFYQVGGLYMMTRLIVNVSQVYVSYYVLDVLKLEKNSIAIVPAVIYVSGIVASIAAKFLNSKLGLRVTFFFGLCFIIGSSTWFYYLPHVSGNARLEVYGASVLLGMGGSTLLIDSLAMISEMIGRNTETSAFVYGSMSFLDKLSNGGAIMLIQYLHPSKMDIFCGSKCQKYYRYIQSLIPGTCAFVALLILLTMIRTKISTSRDCKSKKVGNYKKIDDGRGNKIDDYSSEFSTEGSVNAQPNGKVHT